MPGKFFSVVMVRSIEATVEIVVEANSADDAHGVEARGGEYECKNPRLDLIVWHNLAIDPPAIIDVTA
jgi:hypothetical protein